MCDETRPKNWFLPRTFHRSSSVSDGPSHMESPTFDILFYYQEPSFIETTLSGAQIIESALPYPIVAR